MFEDKNFYISLLKGILISVIISLVAVLVFGLIVKWFSLPDATIKPVGIFIKIIAIFLGVFFSVKGGGGLIKGVIIGGLSFLITALLFLIIGGESFSFKIIWEVLLAMVVGGIAGTLAVNVRKTIY